MVHVKASIRRGFIHHGSTTLSLDLNRYILDLDLESPEGTKISGPGPYAPMS